MTLCCGCPSRGLGVGDGDSSGSDCPPAPPHAPLGSPGSTSGTSSTTTASPTTSIASSKHRKLSMFTTLIQVRAYPVTTSISLQQSYWEHSLYVKKFEFIVQPSTMSSFILLNFFYRPQGKVMFSQLSVCPQSASLDTGSLLGLVMRSVRILLECFLVTSCKQYRSVLRLFYGRFGVLLRK